MTDWCGSYSAWLTLASLSAVGLVGVKEEVEEEAFPLVIVKMVERITGSPLCLTDASFFDLLVRTSSLTLPERAFGLFTPRWII